MTEQTIPSIANALRHVRVLKSLNISSNCISLNATSVDSFATSYNLPDQNLENGNTGDRNAVLCKLKPFSSDSKQDNASMNIDDTFPPGGKTTPKSCSDIRSENTQEENVLMAMTNVITHNYFLVCFDISNCKLSDLQIATVATALNELTTLQTLNLSHNEITYVRQYCSQNSFCNYKQLIITKPTYI